MTTSCKVVVVGDSGVGKTCLMARYLNNKFDNNTITTACPTFATKQLFFNDINKKINLDIWDKAGQELYKSISKLFYKGASIGILVYDITNINSFNSLKDYWYNELKINGDQNIIFNVVGNKVDLYEIEQIKEEDAKSFADSINAGFYLTSAKSNVNIDDLFIESGRKYIEPNYQRKRFDHNINTENTNERKLSKNKIAKKSKKESECC